MADAAFKPAKAGGGFTPANVVAAQLARVLDGAVAEGKARGRAYVRGDQAGAEDDAVRFEQASPQIRKVYSVKRAARPEADGFDLRRGERGGGESKGEFWRGGSAQAGQFQGQGVGGEKDLIRTDFLLMHAAAKVAADLQAQRMREVQRANLGVLHDLRAGVFR